MTKTVTITPEQQALINAASLRAPEAVPAERRCVIEVMDGTGDTKHIWDKGNRDEVDAMKTLYTSMRAKGYLAFKVKGDGDKGEQMTEFDATAERMILVPPMRGG